MQQLFLPYDGQVNIFSAQEAVKEIKKLLKDAPIITKGKDKFGKGQKYYTNTIAAFDIETTRVENKDFDPSIQPNILKAFSYTYCWQYMLYHITEDGEIKELFVFGRDPQEFFDMMNGLKGLDATIVGFIHNLTYEYNNLAFNWNGFASNGKRADIFFKNASTPLYIKYCTHEWRDTAQMTHKSLASLGKDIGYEKLKSDFDYSIERNRQTPLTPLEMNYCYRDVKIVCKWVLQECMNYLKKVNPSALPYTQTGYVRRDIKAAFSSTKYGKAVLQECHLSEEAYHSINRAFFGGYTHSNYEHCGEICRLLMLHCDLTSAYPYVMVTKKFPFAMHKAKVLNVEKYIENLKEEDLAQIATVRFTNIRLKKGYIPYAPYSAFVNGSKYYAKDAVEENGRLMEASEYTATLCDVDMNLIIDAYEWDSIELIELYTGTKKPLPKPVVEVILKYFEQKTTLKGVEEMIYEYMLAKQKVNGIFGMTCQRCENEDYFIDNDGKVQSAGIIYEESKVMPYQWAVYITSYVRAIIYSTICKMPYMDYYYCDTDSIFAVRTPLFEQLVAEHNEKVRAEIDALEEQYPNIKPKNPKGQVQYLGLFTEEEDCSSDDFYGFVTIGAKRYAVLHTDGTADLTVSGLTATKTSIDKETGKRYNGYNTQRLIDMCGSIENAFYRIARGEQLVLPYTEGIDKLSNYNTRCHFEGYCDGELVSTDCSFLLYPMDTSLSLNASIEHLFEIAYRGSKLPEKAEIY